MIPPRTILAATDFSDPSRAALVFAARLARHCQAVLHVVHAEDPLLAAAAEHGGIDLVAQTREELQHAIAAAQPAADCSPQVHVVTGSAVDVILDVARAQHADLVVVGSRGMSGAEKFMFGSITEGILRRVAEARKELERAVNSLGCQVPVEWRVERGSVPERLASTAGRAADRAPVLVPGKKAPHAGGSAPGTIASRVLSLADVPVLMFVD